MAIYHCSIKIIGRSGGRSAAASSAYRSGEKLTDEETGLVHDYTRKTGVIYSEVSLCKNAPRKYQNRETLWNAVHKVEKASNSQLAREIEVALPIEFDEELQKEVMREYVQGFVDEGMCADWAIHDKGDGNPHAHILLTTRPIKENGEWGVKEKKGYALDEKGEKIPIIDESTGKQKVDSRNRKQWKRETIQANDWNDQGKAEQWRQAWAQVCNQYLDKEQQITHKSYKRQGIEQEPTIHEGYAARKTEKAGGVSDRCQINREIHERNQLLAVLKAQIAEIAEKLKEYVWDKIAGNAPEIDIDAQKPVEAVPALSKQKKQNTPFQDSLKRKAVFERRKDRLKEELKSLEKEYEEAVADFHQAQEEEKLFRKNRDKNYLCESEAGQFAKKYHENQRTYVWGEYEKAIFKWRYKSHPVIKETLEIKKWFEDREMDIPSEKELEASNRQLGDDREKYRLNCVHAINKRDEYFRKIESKKSEISSLEYEISRNTPLAMILASLEKPDKTTNHPPITRKERDWGMDR